jgi:hypothetical protein
MKALSLRQPWAAIVVHFGKNIENRVWNTHFRGEFLIHAAKYMTRREYDEAVAFASRFAELPPERELRAMLQFGGIVGRARLVDVIPPHALPLDLCAHAWHMPEQFGFVLKDVKPVPFIKVDGQRGLFTVPSWAIPVA